MHPHEGERAFVIERGVLQRKRRLMINRTSHRVGDETEAASITCP
jgi:hypothetical protein